MSARVQMLAETARLVDACREVGLVVTRMEPYPCQWTPCWAVSLWTPGGGLWMEATHESPSSVLDAVALWRDHPDRAAIAARVSVSARGCDPGDCEPSL